MLALRLDPLPRLDPDYPDPVRAPGEVIVRLRCAGICDTDLELARGYLGFRGVPGHEFVGEVIEADGARWVGRRVTADINAGCGVCPDCTRGSPTAGHHCARRTVLGIAGRDGALAEHFAVPERCLLEVPEEVPDEQAVFAEPLAAALHAVDVLGSVPRVTVIGDGKLGLLTVLALRAQGVPTLAIGRHSHKLEIAAAAGAETRLEWELAESSGGLPSAPAVIEASGSPEGVALALGLVEPRGVIVLKTTVAARFTIDLAPLVVNEVSLVGSRCGNLRTALAGLQAGHIDPLPLVEACYPLNEALAALAHAGRRGAMKILVVPHKAAARAR